MSNYAPPTQPVRVRSTCDVCLDAKVRCSRDRPACLRCQHNGRDCVYSNKRRLGRPRGTTSKARIISQSNYPAGARTNASMNAVESTPNSGCANPPCIPPSHNTSPGPPIPVDEQQHVAFSNGYQSDYSYFPMWIHSPDPDQGGHDALGHGPSRLTNSRTDHNQPGGFNPAYSDVETIGSMGTDSNHSLTLVDSASTAGLAGHLGSPLYCADGIGRAIPPAYLNAVDGSTYDVGTRTPPELPADYNPAISSMLTPNTIPSPRCRCYFSILQRLSQLKDDKFGVPVPGWNYILQLEVDVRTQILSVMRCEQCIYQRNRTLLLVGVVLEIVVELLENTAVADPPMVAGECFSRPTLDDPASSNSNSGSGALYQPSIPSTSTQPGGRSTRREDRRALLRLLVRTRLQEVFVLTQQLHEHAQNVRGLATSFGAADTVMAELSLRVCAFMGRLEGR